MRKTICIISFILIAGCNSHDEHYPECMETTWTLTLLGPDTLNMTMLLFNYDSGGLFATPHLDALFTINGHSYDARVGMGYLSEFNSTVYALYDSTQYFLFFKTFQCKELSGDATVYHNYSDTTFYTFTGREN